MVTSALLQQDTRTRDRGTFVEGNYQVPSSQCPPLGPRFILDPLALIFLVMQSFTDNIEYRLGTRDNSHIFYLRLANVTLKEAPPVKRRYLELYAASYETTYCGDRVVDSPVAGTNCTTYVSHAIYDFRWYNQTQVGGGAW